MGDHHQIAGNAQRFQGSEYIKENELGLFNKYNEAIYRAFWEQPGFRVSIEQ
ncbi:MAG: hypothetical protein WEC83_01100 [Patescibacteria group bacterium]